MSVEQRKSAAQKQETLRKIGYQSSDQSSSVTAVQKPATSRKPINGGIIMPIRGRFDAASREAEATRHWKGADFLSADAALVPEIRHLIISRTRYEAANNGYCAGVLKTLADDTIGTGPRLQYSFEHDDDDMEELEATLNRREYRWRKWSKAVHLSKTLKITRRSRATDGEVFIKKIFNPKIRSHVKIGLELFEAEQVGSSPFDFIIEYHDTGVPKEFDGIKYDRHGNPVAYRFWRIHPGSRSLIKMSSDYEVDASYVIHYANIWRPGQHRGLSEIASTLSVFNDLRRFTNAVLSAAEIAAEISFLLSSDAPVDDDDIKTPTKLEAGTVIELCRNAGIALPAGWEASQMKSEQPTSTHTEFVRSKIREAARPLSMSMNVALGDSSGYNYASGRLDHQTYFRSIKNERDDIEDCILDDLLRDFEKFDRVYYPEDYDDNIQIEHEWMWDGFDHVDPVKEANAQRIRIESRTTTLADECAKDGKDWSRVLRQAARENRMRIKLGLSDTSGNTIEDKEEEGKEDD